MKIFALETNTQKLIGRLLTQDEEVILTVRFSAFLFIIRTLRQVLYTAVLFAVGAGLAYVELPAMIYLPVLLITWFIGVFLPWLTAFIDWRFDVLIVTTEEIVIVNQSSLFRVSIRQMNLENIASVASDSQFWNVFPFGRLLFDLKEGTGKSITLSYIPYAERVSSIISDAMVLFQRRKVTRVGV
jgi:hypothetical protein